MSQLLVWYLCLLLFDVSGIILLLVSFHLKVRLSTNCFMSLLSVTSLYHLIYHHYYRTSSRVNTHTCTCTVIIARNIFEELICVPTFSNEFFSEMLKTLILCTVPIGICTGQMYIIVFGVGMLSKDVNARLYIPQIKNHQ